MVLLVSKPLLRTKVDFLKIKRFTCLFMVLIIIVLIPLALGLNFKTLNQFLVYVVSPTIYLINFFIVYSSIKELFTLGISKIKDHLVFDDLFVLF